MHCECTHDLGMHVCSAVVHTCVTARMRCTCVETCIDMFVSAETYVCTHSISSFLPLEGKGANRKVRREHLSTSRMQARKGCLQVRDM